MSVRLRKLTVEELETFPEDGHRYEIFDGDLSMSHAPHQKHQFSPGLLFRAFDAARSAQSGRVYFSPVDVRFSLHDQVQPDLSYLRRERSWIYSGITVNDAPDSVVEVLSPSNRTYDEVAKFQLYASNGVAEYRNVDSGRKGIRLFAFVDGSFSEVVADASGSFACRQLPGLVIVQNELFKNIDA